MLPSTSPQDNLNLFPDQLDNLIALNPQTCQHVLSDLPNPVQFNSFPSLPLSPPLNSQNGLRKRGDLSPPSSQSDPKKLKTCPHLASPDLSTPNHLPKHVSEHHTPAGLLFVSLQLQTEHPICQLQSHSSTPAAQEPDGLSQPSPEPTSSAPPDALPHPPPAPHESGESTDLQAADPEPVHHVIRTPSPAPYDRPAPQPIQSQSPSSPTPDLLPQQLPSPPRIEMPGSPCRPDEHQPENQLDVSVSPPLSPTPLLPNQPISLPSLENSHLPRTDNSSLSLPPLTHPPSPLPSSRPTPPSSPTSRSRTSSLPALSSRPETLTSCSLPLSSQRPRATSLASTQHAPLPPLGPLQELPHPPPGQLPEPLPDSLQRSPPPPPPLSSLRAAEPARSASTDPPTKLPRPLARYPTLPTPSSNHLQSAVTDENINAHQPAHERRHERPVSPAKATWAHNPGASPPKRYMFSSPLKAIQPSLAGAKAVVPKAGEGGEEKGVSPVKTGEQSIKSSPSKTLTSPAATTSESSVKSPSKFARILPSSLQPGRSTGGAQPTKALDQPLLLGAPSSESTKLNNLSKRLAALKSSSARMRVMGSGSSATGGESAPRQAFEEPGTRPRARRMTGGSASGMGERRPEGLFRAATAESEQMRLAQLTERQTNRNRTRFCRVWTEEVKMECQRPGSPEARFRKGAKNKQKKRATREEEQRMEEEWEDEELEIKLETGQEEGRRRRVQWKDRVVGEDEEVCRPTESGTKLKGILKPRRGEVDGNGNLIEPLPGTIVREYVKVIKRIWKE